MKNGQQTLDFQKIIVLSISGVSKNREPVITVIRRRRLRVTAVLTL
jgi:hypothetical protein